MAALDFPNAPTLGQQYAAPNGAIYTWDGAAWTVSGVLSTGTAAGGDLSGTYPNPTVTPAAKSKWSTIGATITPVDTSKTVACAPVVEALTWGLPSNPPARLGAYTDEMRISLNRKGDGTPDVSTKPAWFLGLYGGATNDRFRVARAPIGSSSAADLLTVDGTGQLTLPNGFLTATGTGRTMKGRFHQHTNDSLYLTTNYAIAPAVAQDDVGQPSWVMNFGGVTGAENLRVRRAPPGSTTLTDLLSLDGAGVLTVPGDTTAGGVVMVGSRTAKTRLLAHPTADAGFLMFNRNLAAVDDATKPTWQLGLSGAIDTFDVSRAAPGAGVTMTNLLRLDGPGNLTITGAVATKASGTTWANPSDARMKRNVADYTTGLDAICQLRPVSFEFNGELGSVDTGDTCYGYLAQEVEPVMPECVGERAWVAPVVEGETPDQQPAPVMLKTLDQSNMLLALVNAVQELAARVAALEAVG